MATQLTLHNSFRVRGGRKADLLWHMIYALGLSDQDEDQDNPKIDFVCHEKAKTRPGAVVIYAAVEAERSQARGIIAFRHWEDVIFVDSEGDERALQMRCLQRWLFNQD